MKTLVLSMISIAATIAAMTACTSESDPINDITNPKDAKVEIKLNAGVGSIISKASIESNESGQPSSPVQNVFLYKKESASEPTWTTESFTQAINSTINNDGTIEFSDDQYYPLNDNNVYFVGLYTGKSTVSEFTSGSATLTITGDEDILYAAPINAGKRSDIATEENRKMVFNHKLTQIKFTFLKDASITDNISITGMKITKVGTTGIHNSCTIALNNGVLNDWKGDISSSGIAIECPTTALENINPTDPTNGVMVEPEIGTIEIEVNSDAFPSKKLTSIITAPASGNFKAGTSYTIALTVKDKSISGTASITKWDTENGTGDL